MNSKKDEVDKLMLNFERSRQFISREPQMHEIIPDFTHCVDHFVENLYVYLFGSSQTKNFFRNSDINYIKYKQKLFFLKLLKNELDPVDLRDLEAVHSKMNIKTVHFQLCIQFAKDSLEEIRLSPKITNFILEKFQSLHDYICLEKN